MTILELLIVTVGITHLMLLTAYKYNLDTAYEEWISDRNLKLLPKQFCVQCFVTQSTLMVSSIIVVSLGLPMWYIIILTLSTAPYVIFLNNNIQ
jgi:hypothetical protein